jgi:hypothetical protein
MIKRGKIAFQVLTILSLVILISINIYAEVDTSGAYHSESDFEFSIGGQEVTLQEAIDESLLMGGIPISFPTTFPSPGHDARNIWVSVDGVEQTLATALKVANGLCATHSGGTTTEYSNVPSTGVYHLANQISISPGYYSFQGYINQATFCGLCEPTSGSSCYPAGFDIRNGDSCVNKGTLNCEGVCEGASYKSEGTSCIQPRTHLLGVCDGAGYCGLATCQPGEERACSDFNEDCTTYSGILTCGADGEWPSSDICISTPRVRGTPCGDEDYLACDDAANCMGFEGTGCGVNGANCPFGSSVDGDEETCDMPTNKVYQSRWIDYTYKWIAFLVWGYNVPLQTDFNSWGLVDPICARNFCTDWNLWGGCNSRSWRNLEWQMKPVGESCGTGGCQPEYGETCLSCVEDCSECPSGISDCDYNGECEGEENSYTCPSDCNAPIVLPCTTSTCSAQAATYVADNGPLPCGTIFVHNDDGCPGESCLAQVGVCPSSTDSCVYSDFAGWHCVTAACTAGHECNPATASVDCVVSGSSCTMQSDSCYDCIDPSTSEPDTPVTPTTPCGNDCTLGAQFCFNGGSTVGVCTSTLDADPCTEWSYADCSGGDACDSTLTPNRCTNTGCCVTQVFEGSPCYHWSCSEDTLESSCSGTWSSECPSFPCDVADDVTCPS